MNQLFKTVLLLGVMILSLYGQSYPGSRINNSKFCSEPNRTMSQREKILPMQSKGTPHEINYQGWLGNAGDTSSVTDTLNMVFRLYNAPTGGANLWEEFQNNVIVDKGIFNVLLGSATSIPPTIFTGIPLYLETQVETEVLTPRKKIVSDAYAMKAENADNSIYADTADYALSANIQYVDSAGVSANSWRWNNNLWGDEYPKANRADTADYALTANVGYVDSARVSANAWNWNNNPWGIEYPKANISDTTNYIAGVNVVGEVTQANHSDTADYALTTSIQYVDSAGVSANSWRWNNNLWGDEYPKANRADTADYTQTAQASDSARIAANAHKLQGQDTTTLDERYVNEGQTNSISTEMIQDAAIIRADVATNFKAPYSDTADYARVAPTSGGVNYYSLPAHAFRPQYSTQTYEGVPWRLYATNNVPQGNWFGSPVYFPDSSEVTEMKAWVFDNNNSTDISVVISRTPLNVMYNIQDYLATVTSSGNSGLQEITDNTINFGLIDNLFYKYYIGVFLPSPDTTNMMVGVRIRFNSPGTYVKTNR